MEAVRSYYGAFGEREWSRLENPADGALEWALTRRRILQHLPEKSRVLDIGGGPGRYALWLASLGHRVVLADLTPELLDIARLKVRESGVEERIEEIVEANACDLSRWPDGSFDAVLSLGPFYHLPDVNDRTRAASEIARVVRADGIVFAAFMPRLTLLFRTIAIPDERHHLLDPAWVTTLLETGVFMNDVPGRFNGGYGARPEEIGPFMESFGFETISISSTDGMTRGMPQPVSDLLLQEGPLAEVLLHLLDSAASEPSLLGTAGHLLYVARRSS
ncbi:MAG: class I SAM-dependent methyltransferase [Dehalococcoidia bacterium]|nr:class I SAM-dependent methyltransferase [Dehalococcoidia bacterium]